MRRKLKPEKINYARKALKKEFGSDPLWREWLDLGGPEFVERVSRELDKIKPPLGEMVLDLVEAGWVLENPDGDFSFLAKKKKDIVTALWKLTQIIKGHYKGGQTEKEEWRRRLDG